MTTEEMKKAIAELRELARRLEENVANISDNNNHSDEHPCQKSEGGAYYSIDYANNKIDVFTESGYMEDMFLYTNGNYYLDLDEAEADLKELRERAALRYLRDSLCEGYQFNCDRQNWYVFKDEVGKSYLIANSKTIRFVGTIYFDTKEHAMQAAKWMNEHFR